MEGAGRGAAIEPPPAKDSYRVLMIREDLGPTREPQRTITSLSARSGSLKRPRKGRRDVRASLFPEVPVGLSAIWMTTALLSMTVEQPITKGTESLTLRSTVRLKTWLSTC